MNKYISWQILCQNDDVIGGHTSSDEKKLFSEKMQNIIILIVTKIGGHRVCNKTVI